MIVRPRVISPLTGEAILAEDAIAALADQGQRGTVQILGKKGAGRTTAISYLAEVFAGYDDIVVFPGAAKPADIARQETRRLVVSKSRDVFGAEVTLHLAPWGEDEFIEYLLAAHPDRCASVMRRLRAMEDKGLAEGLPELWRIVLDRMAGDELIGSVRSALLLHLMNLLPDEFSRGLTGDYCLEEGTGGAEHAYGLLNQVKRLTSESTLFRSLQHQGMRRLLAADRLVAALARGEDSRFLEQKLSRELVAETGRQIVGEADALRRVERLATGDARSAQPMASSVMYAHNQEWRPAAPPRNLVGAYLDGINWRGIDLSGANLAGAYFNRAELSRAKLRQVSAMLANFNRATLKEALLDEISANGASFWRADLSGVIARRAKFANAKLPQANLTRAALISAVFDHADLSGACFRGAKLSDAFLAGADITNADFSDADLGYARLTGLCLRTAELAGASFTHADADRCDLEYVELIAADFSWASLVGAYLTGSVMPGVDFQHADLRKTGLADVQWESADLQNADLRGCSFHMGSTRSGRVPSPYPSHGTRTGFYTDDYDEQHFKSPEQIRKANLRGADLRGARVDDVDFYLVDLRDAKYDEAQETHFQRCGAILYSRV